MQDISKLILVSISSLTAAACATGGLVGDHLVMQRAAVKLRFEPQGDASVTFPKAIAPSLPSVDSIAHVLRAQLGDTATAQLDLCVSPSGKVTKASIARGSFSDAFDAAVEQDAAAWRFHATPGASQAELAALAMHSVLQTCSRVTVIYRM